MKHHLVKLWNAWPPFLGAGIRIDNVTKDGRRIDVSLRLRPWNRNIVGTHFGGSLFAMSDPFYMAILLNALGKDYIVWDKASTIRFKQPGKGTVRCSFTVDEARLAEIRAAAETTGRTEPVFIAQIFDASGAVVAEVEKTILVKKKRR